MTPRLAAIAIATALSMGLVACSPEDASRPSISKTAIAPDQAFDAVSQQGRGFSVGAIMSTQAVYVLFDPQCPHCGRLWNATLPLHAKVKFVWVPVSLLGPKSLPQGAALLQAANPLQAMTAHKESLLIGQGGMPASSSVPEDVSAAIKANTQLLNNLGAESVPFIVARHAGTGAVVTHAGAMETPALMDLLGLTQP